MFKIAKIKIKNNLCLAPMAGISNEAFRILCTKCGAGFVYSEMISDIAIIKKNKKTLEILKHCKNEKNIIIQLFGSDSDTLSQAAKIIEKTCKPIAIDINMGCPVSKVCIKKKAGSALLKNPQKIKEIVTAVVCSVKIPVTVKIRAGWDKNNINCVEIAKIIEKCGAKLIAIHPRTRAEMFEGKSNWELIKKVKQAVNIPVIGNGDILNHSDIKRIIKETKCDGVMIGRGAIGNPWIFSDNDKQIELKNIFKMIIEHLILLHKEYNNYKYPILLIRQHLGHYFKGLKNKKQLLKEIYSINDYKLLLKYFKNKI